MKTNFLDRNDIFRAYQCPEMFAKHVRDGATEIDPKAITRTFIENNLPLLLGSVKDKGPGFAAALAYSENDKPHGIQNLYQEIHQAQARDGVTPPDFPDTWTREKNLYLGVALWLSKKFSDKQQRGFIPYAPEIFLREQTPTTKAVSYQYFARPALKVGNQLTIFEVTSSLREEDDLWSDVALCADIASLIHSLAVASANGLDGLAEEADDSNAFTADTIFVQQIVTGRKADQWYENPLCRYWQHTAGQITYSGQVDGKGVRAPAWTKQAVMDPMATDRFQTETMADHVQRLGAAYATDPSIPLAEMFPQPLRIGLNEGSEWAEHALKVRGEALHELWTMLETLSEEPSEGLVRQYTACRFPTVCRFWEDCWK